MNPTQLLSTYEPLLASRLTSARLEHSIGVMRVAGELAAVVGLDRERACLAGLLHDAAKDLSQPEQMDWVERGRFKMVDPCEVHPVYLHAPAGAALIESELGVRDDGVLQAVACHSYGGAWEETIHPFSLCLRIADVLAPVTPWRGMAKMRQVALAGRLDQATLLHAHWVKALFAERAVPWHPNLVRVEREWTASVQPAGPDFFQRDHPQS